MGSSRKQVVFEVEIYEKAEKITKISGKGRHTAEKGSDSLTGLTPPLQSVNSQVMMK